MSARRAVALVARREITQRVREKSFLVSMGVFVLPAAALLLYRLLPAAQAKPTVAAR